MFNNSSPEWRWRMMMTKKWPLSLRGVSQQDFGGQPLRELWTVCGNGIRMGYFSASLENSLGSARGSLLCSVRVLVDIFVRDCYLYDPGASGKGSSKENHMCMPYPLKRLILG